MREEKLGHYAVKMGWRLKIIQYITKLIVFSKSADVEHGHKGRTAKGNKCMEMEITISSLETKLKAECVHVRGRD